MAGIKLVIPGEPIAKKRPRFARRGKFVTTYNDQQTEEGKFIAQVLAQINGESPLSGPLMLKLSCYKSRPKGHYGTGRNAGKIKKSAPHFPTTKPDLDNYVKFVLDCLNEIVFRDDALVVEEVSCKRYSRKPRTEIEITEMAGVLND